MKANYYIELVHQREAIKREIKEYFYM